MADRVGQQLGNYRLVNLLGKGGFAEVYLGQHVRLNTYAAVKVLHTRLANSKEIEDFEKEAQTIAHLEHPNIVRVFDFDVVDDTPFLIMSYAAGGTLRQRHPKGSILPLPTIVAYIKQAADALQYAHDQHLIHRDVKPENMLIGGRGEVLLSDFGIATVAHHTSSQTTEVMAGTIPYMAPEQVQGKPRPASDQYALGIVVYEWLSGGRPFNGTPTEIAMQHVMAPVPSLRENGHTISPDVEQVVMMALAKDYKQRFGSMRAFANALEQASQSKQTEPIAMQEGSTSQEIGPKGAQQSTKTAIPASQRATVENGPTNASSQYRGSEISAAASGLMPGSASKPSEKISVAGSGSSRQQDHSLVMDTTPQVPSSLPTSPAVPSSPSPFQLVVPSKSGISRRTILVGLAGLVVVGGGATWLVYSRGQHPSITIGQTSTPKPSPSPTPTPIPSGTLLYTYRGHTDIVNTVAWSPDGKRIASGSNDKTVQVWDAANGGNLYTYRGHSNNVHSVAWSPDGKRIASGSGDNTVQVWDATNGGNLYTYRGHSNVVRSVAWSPDGRRIASGSNDDTAQVWDAANGGNVYTYHGHADSYVAAVAWSPDGRRIASGGNDHTAQVWDAADGGNVYTYRGHADIVYAVPWSPDGMRIASGSADSTVQVWDAANGGNAFIYHGHADVVQAVAWSPNGQRITSGGRDTTVQVWDAVDGGHVFTYRGHSSVVEAVAWSPDGGRIASGSDDKTVQVWGAG